MQPRQNGFIAIVMFILVATIFAAITLVVYKSEQAHNQEVRSIAKRAIAPTPSPSSTSKPSPAATPTVSLQQPLSSGIEGTVFCVDKTDSQPCAATIEFRKYIGNSEEQEQVLGRVTTNNSGRFRVNLAPGKYVVYPLPKAGYPLFVPPLQNPATVTTNQFLKFDIHYHNGLK